MEIIEKYYYDKTQFSNTYYLIMMNIQQWFANNLFRGTANRVLYASPEFAFRQRLNLLSLNGVNTLDAMQLPFMSYYHENNWELDDRPGGMNALNALVGSPDGSIGYESLRYMMMQAKFTCVAWYSSFIDAQMGYETINFLKYPSDKQIVCSSVTYKGTNLDIPLTLGVEDVQFNPESKDVDWLKQNRVIPVKFTLRAKSIVFSQGPQGPESTIWTNDAPPVITESVLLNFWSNQGLSDDFTQQHITDIVTGVFTADPELMGVFTAPTITDTSITLAWTFNNAVIPNYQSNVLIGLGNGTEAYVPMTNGTYTFTGLQPQSSYTAYIIFYALDDSVTIYNLTVPTTSVTSAPLALKAMKAY